MKRNLKNISMIDLYEDLSIADAILYESIRDLQNFEATVEFQSCDIGELDPRFINLLKSMGVDVTKMFAGIASKGAELAKNAAIPDKVQTGYELAKDVIGTLKSSPTSAPSGAAISESSSDDPIPELENMVDRSKNEAGFRESWAKAMKISCGNDDFEPGDPMAMDFINQTAKDAFVQVAMPLAQLSMMPMGSICKFIISLNNKFVELLDTAAASYCKGRKKTSKEKQDEIDNNEDRKRFIGNLNKAHGKKKLFFEEPLDDDSVANYDDVFGNLNAMGYGKTNLMAINFFHILYPNLSSKLTELLAGSIAPSYEDDKFADSEDDRKVRAMKRRLKRKAAYRDHLTEEEFENLFNLKWPGYTRSKYVKETGDNTPTSDEYFQWREQEFEEDIRKLVEEKKANIRTEDENARISKRDAEKRKAEADKLDKAKKSVKKYERNQETSIQTSLNISRSELNGFKNRFKGEAKKIKIRIIDNNKSDPDFPRELLTIQGFDRNIEDHPSYNKDYKELYYSELRKYIIRSKKSSTKPSAGKPKSKPKKGTGKGKGKKIKESFVLDYSNINRSLRTLYLNDEVYVNQINEDIFFKNSLNNLSLNYLFEDTGESDDTDSSSPSVSSSTPVEKDAKQIAWYVSNLPALKREHKKVKSLLVALDRYDKPLQIDRISRLFGEAESVVSEYLRAVKKDSGEFNNRKKEIESAIKAVINELDRIGFK